MKNKKACIHLVDMPKLGASEHIFPFLVVHRKDAPLIWAAYELLQNHLFLQHQLQYIFRIHQTHPDLPFIVRNATGRDLHYHNVRWQKHDTFCLSDLVCLVYYLHVFKVSWTEKHLSGRIGFNVRLSIPINQEHILTAAYGIRDSTSYQLTNSLVQYPSLFK